MNRRLGISLALATAFTANAAHADITVVSALSASIRF